MLKLCSRTSRTDHKGYNTRAGEIPSPGRQQQDCCKVEASLGYRGESIAAS